MGFHVHLRGKLEYATPEDAAAAHRTLVGHDNYILDTGARVRDNVLVLAFDDFGGDASRAVDRLSAAAETAIAGKLLYDDEAGEQFQISAGAFGIGGPLAAGDVREDVLLEGTWTFAGEDDARRAFEVLAAALVRHPPRALSSKGAVLRVSFEGQGPSKTVDAVRRALFAIAPTVVSGKMRLRRRYGGITHLDAPFRALDDDPGERRYVLCAGFVTFRNERLRDAVFATVSPFGAVTKGKQKIIIDVQGTIAAARLVALESALDAAAAAAVRGHVALSTAERSRTLVPHAGP